MWITNRERNPKPYPPNRPLPRLSDTDRPAQVRSGILDPASSNATAQTLQTHTFSVDVKARQPRLSPTLLLGILYILSHKLSRRRYLREKLKHVEHHICYFAHCERNREKIPKGLCITNSINPIKHNVISGTRQRIGAILQKADKDVVQVLTSHYNNLSPKLNMELDAWNMPTSILHIVDEHFIDHLYKVRKT